MDFDAVLDYEDGVRAEGRKQGRKAAAVTGFCDGFGIGMREGRRVSEEVGFYAGAAAVVAAASRPPHESLTASKTSVAAEQLLRLTSEFPFAGVRNGEAAEALQQLRAKYRLLRALSRARLPPPPGTQDAATNGGSGGAAKGALF